MAKKILKPEIEVGEEGVAQLGETVAPDQDGGKALEAGYQEFLNTDSKFNPDDTGTQIPGEEKKPGEVAPPISVEQQMKLRMFLGFMCFLLSAANTFIFNMLFKADVPVKEMLLDEDEQRQIEPYLNSPQILAFIDKLPGWVIAVAHVEYMMYDKFMDVKDQYPKKQKLKVVKQQEKDETQNE